MHEMRFTIRLMTNTTRPVRYTFFVALLIGVSVLTTLMFLPYLITLAVATTFAVVLQPVYRAFMRLTKDRESIAALLTIFVTAIVILAPLSLIGTQVAWEATDLYNRLNEQQEDISETFISTIESYIEQYIPQANIDLDPYIGQSLRWFAQLFGTIFANTLQLLLHIFLGVIAFYYLLKDGHTFAKTVTGLSPLADSHDRQIFSRLSLAINSIIKGSLLIALIQGVVTGIGFAIFGVPSATLWGSLAAIGALVPGIGTSIVIAPAVIYLFAIGNTGAAVGLIVWGAFAVGMIDNFLGPYLVGRGVRIHPLFILFAVIGGLEFFGPVGFILGPLLLSLLYALLDIYRILFLNQQPATPPARS